MAIDTAEAQDYRQELAQELRNEPDHTKRRELASERRFSYAYERTAQTHRTERQSTRDQRRLNQLLDTYRQEAEVAWLDHEHPLPIETPSAPSAMAELPTAASYPSTAHTLGERFRQTQLSFQARRKGIAHPEMALAIIRFLEATSTTHRFEYRRIPRDKTEVETARLEAEGWYVMKPYSDPKPGEQPQYHISRDEPFRFESHDWPMLKMLTSENSDPIPVIDLLRRFNYISRDGGLRYYKDLPELLQNPELQPLLAPLITAGCRFSHESWDPDTRTKAFEEFLHDPSTKELIQPERLSKLQPLLAKSGKIYPLPMRRVHELLTIADDDEAIALAQELAGQGQPHLHTPGSPSREERTQQEFPLTDIKEWPALIGKFKRDGTLPLLQALAEAGLNLRSLGIFTADILTEPSENESDWDRKNRQHASERYDALRQHPLAEQLQTDGSLREFIHRAAVLLPEAPSLEQLEVIVRMAAQPDRALAILGFVHKADGIFGNYDYRPLEFATQVMANPESYLPLMNPEALQTLVFLHESVGLELRLSDVQESIVKGSKTTLAEFLKDQDLMNKIRESAPLFKHLGQRHPDYFSLYNVLTVLGEPKLAATLEQLEQSYGPDWTFGDYGWLDMLTSIANKPEKLAQLTNEQTISFVHRLLSAFPMPMTLKRIEECSLLADNEKLRSDIEDPEFVKFVNATDASIGSPSRVAEYAGLPADLRATLQTLRTSLSYHYSYRFSEQSVNALRALSEHPKQLQELGSPERMAFLKRLEASGAFPAYTFAVEHVANFLAMTETDITLAERLMHDFQCPMNPARLPLLRQVEAAGEPFLQIVASLQTAGITVTYERMPNMLALAAYAPGEVQQAITSLVGVDGFPPLDTRPSYYPNRTDRYDTFPALRTILERHYDQEALQHLVAIGAEFEVPANSLFTSETFPHLLIAQERLPELRQAQADLLAAKLPITLHPLKDTETIISIHQANLLPLFMKFRDNPSLFKELFEHHDRLATINPEQRELYATILSRIAETPSQEMKRIADQVIREVMAAEDPAAVFNRVEQVFIRNNIPMVGKVFEVFETLFSPEALDDLIKRGPQISPVLRHASRRHRRQIIWEDLLRVHVLSGNHSLRHFVETISASQALMTRADQEGFQNLNDDEQEQLEQALEKLETVMATVHPKRPPINKRQAHGDLQSHWDRLRQELGAADDQSLTDRLSEMFLRPFQARQFSDMPRLMNASRAQQQQRSLAIADEASAGTLQLQAGDFLKGVQHEYMTTTLENGIVAREYLGANSQTDATPLDTDMAKLLPERMKPTISETIVGSMAHGYGEVLLCFRDHGQFQITSADQPARYDRQKFELFRTGTEEHYGVRTGLPTTEIEFMIVHGQLEMRTPELRRMFFDIARHGTYIPVIDSSGHLLFTPEQFATYRRIFRGIDHYDGDPLDLDPTITSETALAEAEPEIATIRQERRRTVSIINRLTTSVRQILAPIGIRVTSTTNQDLRYANLIATGSADRGTSLPGDDDYDFVLLLNSNDIARSDELADAIRSTLEITSDRSHADHEGGYQLRAQGVTRMGTERFDHPIDIDIAFARKGDLLTYGTQDAMNDRFESLRLRYGDDVVDAVRGQIVSAKRILKEAKVYKKFEEQGLGGVGVENFILTNGGSVVRAFRRFVEAAIVDGHLIPLPAFQEQFPIIDPGVNLKTGQNDDFIKHLTSGSYQRMVETMQQYLLDRGEPNLPTLVPNVEPDNNVDDADRL